MDIVATKPVNALIPGAEISFLAKFLLTSAHASLGLEAAKKFTGGLWVGGALSVFQHELVFRPNWLNRLFHRNIHGVAIPLMEISDVNVRSVFVTSIIDVVTQEGTLSVRCYGAAEFAEVIRRQAAVERSARREVREIS